MEEEERLRREEEEAKQRAEEEEERRGEEEKRAALVKMKELVSGTKKGEAVYYQPYISLIVHQAWLPKNNNVY